MSGEMEKGEEGQDLCRGVLAVRELNGIAKLSQVKMFRKLIVLVMRGRKLWR